MFTRGYSIHQPPKTEQGNMWVAVWCASEVSEDPLGCSYNFEKDNA